MPTMKTKITLLSIALAGALVLSGCAANQASPEPGVSYDKSGVCTALPKEKVYIKGDTVKQYVVYTPDVDLKPAVVILMRKVDLLEKRVGVLEGKAKTFGAATHPKVIYTSCGPAEPVKKKYKKYKDGLYVAKTKTPIWSCATTRGQRIGYIYKETKVRLSKCGIYGWCKIDGQKGYIQAFRLKRIGD